MSEYRAYPSPTTIQADWPGIRCHSANSVSIDKIMDVSRTTAEQLIINNFPQVRLNTAYSSRLFLDNHTFYEVADRTILDPGLNLLRLKTGYIGIFARVRNGKVEYASGISRPSPDGQLAPPGQERYYTDNIAHVLEEHLFDLYLSQNCTSDGREDEQRYELVQAYLEYKSFRDNNSELKPYPPLQEMFPFLTDGVFGFLAHVPPPLDKEKSSKSLYLVGECSGCGAHSTFEFGGKSQPGKLACPACARGEYRYLFLPTTTELVCQCSYCSQDIRISTQKPGKLVCPNDGSPIAFDFTKGLKNLSQ